MLKSLHQSLPLLDLRIRSVCSSFIREREVVGYLHDHEKPPTKKVDLHVENTGCEDAVPDLRPYSLVVSPVFRNGSCIVF